MSTITSRGNPAFKALLAAKKDKELMLLEGRRLVTDALARGMTPELAAATPDYGRAHGPLDFPHAVLDEALFSRIADTKTPQGILAFFPAPWASLDTVSGHERLVILDGVQDPGNVGTILRAAEAFGFTAALVTSGTASPFSSKAVRSSMGSSLGVAVAGIARTDVKRLPHRIISLAPRGTWRMTRALFEGRTAVCLGGEARGVSPEILSISHATVSIPMKGRVESLNVSVAAGVVLAYASGVLD